MQFRSERPSRRRTTKERILRYVDGTSRTIRYIAEEDSGEAYEAGRDGPPCGLATATSEFSESWILEHGLCALDPQDASHFSDFLRDEETGLPSSSPAAFSSVDSDQDAPQSSAPVTSASSLLDSPRPSPPAPAQSPHQPPDLDSPPSSSFDLSSPEAFLRFIQSDGYRRDQRALKERVQASYQILREVPWALPRPLFVLALTGERVSLASTPEGDTGKAYTLRTKIPDPSSGPESDLSRVYRLRKAPPSALSVFRLVDGLVAFEDEEAAGRYARSLEAEGYRDTSSREAPLVHVAAMDSHVLFRTVQDARGVVVLVRPLPPDRPCDDDDRPCEEWLVEPGQLAAALRGKGALEELEGGEEL